MGRDHRVSWTGHFWTLNGYLRRSLRPPRAPPSRQWSTGLNDPDVGAIRLTGKLSEPAVGASALVVLIHGLGGCCDSPYVVEAAVRLVNSGLACLRLNLRGADRTGEDIYHGGLITDLVATLASPEIVTYDRIGLLGFSLGGHVALRFAIDAPPARLRAVATVCPPVDLAAAATTIDSGSSWVYRRYLLKRLFEIYAEVARRRQVDKSVEEVRRVSTFVEFDSLVIAPRYGFVDAWDYYRTVSVGPDLARLQVPSLIVAAAGDPMVPVGSLRKYVPGSSAKLEWFWSKQGGHMGFPTSLDLGSSAAPGLYPQIQGWLSHHLAV